jgi:uncharacterized membrane protein YhaH (DUF805 family)
MWNLEEWIEKQPRSRRLKYYWVSLVLSILYVIQNLVMLWQTAPGAWRTLFGPHA